MNLIATDKGNVKISTLTGKLSGIRAINTNTLSNAFCSKMRKTDAICNQCYSAAMLEGSRKNCVKPWESNSEILSTTKITHVPYINESVFRFHAHGELINRLHYENYVAIAAANPHCIFTLWTKRKDLVRGIERPANMILIFSNSRTDRVLKRVPAGFDKVFNAIKKEHRQPTDNVNCHSKCIDCRLCYSINDVKVITEIAKIRS